MREGDNDPSFEMLDSYCDPAADMFIDLSYVERVAFEAKMLSAFNTLSHAADHGNTIKWRGVRASMAAETFDIIGLIFPL